MKKREIFVCCRYDDRKYLRKIKRWAMADKIGDYEVSIVTTSDDELKNKFGKTIRGKVRHKLKNVSFIIIIVGDNNKRHPWQEYEKFAKDSKITRYYTRIPYTKDPLPPFLKGIKQIAYNPNILIKLLKDQDDAENTNGDSDDNGSTA